MYIASEVLLIRPTSSPSPQIDFPQVLEECHLLETALTAVGIEVTVFEDNRLFSSPSKHPINYWVSFHTTGELIQYPVSDPSQRPDILSDITQHYLDRDPHHDFIDLAEYEHVDVFLEGTESILYDRKNRMAYACESPRTHPGFFERFCQYFRWEPVVFQMNHSQNQSIIHTSQLMTLGEDFALLCKELLPEPTYRALTIQLEAGGRACIEVSLAQMKEVASGVIELQNKQGERYLILSKKVLDFLETSLVKRLEGFGNLLPLSLDCIDALWGRGVRGVLTELFTYQPENSLHET